MSPVVSTAALGLVDSQGVPRSATVGPRVVRTDLDAPANQRESTQSACRRRDSVGRRDRQGRSGSPHHRYSTRGDLSLAVLSPVAPIFTKRRDTYFNPYAPYADPSAAILSALGIPGPTACPFRLTLA